MGTRSTIHFFEGDEKSPLVSIYQQYDGYPSGVGLELAEFLAPIILVNGFGMDMKAGTHANGVGCLAAQFIAKSKSEIGGFYITEKNDSQEYDYVVRAVAPSGFGEAKTAGSITVKVIDHGSQVFEGTPQEFLDFCKSGA